MHVNENDATKQVGLHWNENVQTLGQEHC